MDYIMTLEERIKGEIGSLVVQLHQKATIIDQQQDAIKDLSDKVQQFEKQMADLGTIQELRDAIKVRDDRIKHLEAIVFANNGMILETEGNHNG